MTKKSKLALFSVLGISSAIVALPFVAAQCGQTNSNKEVIVKTAGYSDTMTKLLAKDVTLAGAWGDARNLIQGDTKKDIAIIGATDFISNDGVQARSTLKQGDIEAIQTLLIDAIKKAKSGDEALKIEIQKDGKSKKVQLFSVYNHDSYSKVGLDANISYNVNGDKKKAYQVTPEQGNEYFVIENGVVKTKPGAKEFNIVFIPSSDPTNVTKATVKLSQYFKTQGITNIKIQTSTSYDAAATQLSSNTVELAFLPVDTWATKSGKSSFILQAGRNVQIVDPYKSVTNVSEPALDATTHETVLVDAMNHYAEFNSKVEPAKALYISDTQDKRPTTTEHNLPQVLLDAINAITPVAQGSSETLPTVGYYRSYIYARKDSEIYKLITEAMKRDGSNWTLKWDDVKKYVKYGYTSTTSSASYTYPEKWFQKHFTGFKSFKSLK
ncbi:hypothetical protein [[Mycoplasma] gypis]|uniref:Uncharacterized protein n=1 Tax=[Mycoplasma] gypis TaxID=92404 RepID=A0ABZ2RR22_9BACT|nr:hypothetical protein [[Mycoplasma] gypis]MBN0919214.1 hypothetical protein [[Mycoplasma] gypis]